MAPAAAWAISTRRGARSALMGQATSMARAVAVIGRLTPRISSWDGPAPATRTLCTVDDKSSTLVGAGPFGPRWRDDLTDEGNLLDLEASAVWS